MQIIHKDNLVKQAAGHVSACLYRGQEHPARSVVPVVEGGTGLECGAVIGAADGVRQSGRNGEVDAANGHVYDGLSTAHNAMPSGPDNRSNGN